MRGGLSGASGIILYDTDKQGENAVYGYYEEDEIIIKKGDLDELKKLKIDYEKPLKRKDNLTHKLVFGLAFVLIALIVGTFVITSFFKGLFISIILILAYFPILVLFFANVSLYESKTDFEQFKRNHGAEHSCLRMMSSKKELSIENLEESSIYDPECGTVYMGYLLTLLALIAILGLNIASIGLLKFIGIVIVVVILLFLNVMNPYNPFVVLQKNVVARPTKREYELALELLKNLEEL